MPSFGSIDAMFGRFTTWLDQDGGRRRAPRPAISRRDAAENGLARSFLALRLCCPVNSHHATHWSQRELLRVIVLNAESLLLVMPVLSRARWKLRVQQSAASSRAASSCARGY